MKYFLFPLLLCFSALAQPIVQTTTFTRNFLARATDTTTAQTILGGPFSGGSTNGIQQLNGNGTNTTLRFGRITGALTNTIATASKLAGYNSRQELTNFLASDVEANFLVGVTSAIQTQMDAKAAAATTISAGAGTSGGGSLAANRTITWDPSTFVNALTFWDGSQASRTLTIDLSGTDPVFTFTSGVVNISTGALQVGGVAVITTASISDTAYGAGLNGATTVAPSQNVFYDYEHLSDTDDDGLPDKLDLGTAGLVRTTSGGVISSAEMSGDITTSGSNAATIANSAVTTAKINNNAVDGTKIALGSDAQGDIMYYNGTDYVRLAPGNSGEFLKTQGAAANPVWAASTGSGDVTAAATFATDNVVIRSDGTGKGVQKTGISVDDSNNVTGVASLTVGSGSAVGEMVLGDADNSNSYRMVAPSTIVTNVNLILADRPSSGGIATYAVTAVTNVTQTFANTLSALETALGGVNITDSTELAAVISDVAYDPTTWNSVTTVSPSKNAVRDQIVLLAPLADPIFTSSLQLPNGAAPTTDAFGEVAGDNNAWATGRGTLQIFDGTANTYAVNVLASDTPTNGQVPKWNTGGTITWEDDSAGVGVGDSVLVNGGATTDADFQDTLSIAWIGTGVSPTAVKASFAQTATLAGNPALAANGVAFGTTGLIFEGATADTIEGLLAAADQTGADHTWTLPNADTFIPISAQILTFAGPTAPRTITFPDAAITVARTDAANTFTGHQTVEGVTSTGATGTQKFVFDTSPTLVTPVLGVATLTSANKWIFTAPTTAATLTAGADNLTYTGPSSSQTLVGVTSTDTLQNKTTATTWAGGNNTHTRRLYLPLQFTRCAAISMIGNTNDFTLASYGRPRFPGNSTATNSNYAIYRSVVPIKFVGASGQDLTLEKLTYKTTGTQTGATTFHIGVLDVADSAAADPADSTTFGNYVACTSGTLTSSAANDRFSTANVTLTGWRSALTAGHDMAVCIVRNDTNTDGMDLIDCVISYVETQ